MLSYVRVISGRTRQDQDVSGRVFELLQQPKKDKDGLYIVVDGTPYKDLRSGRTRVYLDSPTEYEPVEQSQMGKVSKNEEIQGKSDDEIREEIEETFEILAEMTKAAAAGVVKGLVVSGPAGVGKSHTVEQTLHEELGVLAAMRGQKSMYEVIHGAMSASVLYEKLWLFKDNCNVLVFDDCDGVLYDEDALNVLKAALDSKPVRKIHWNTNSYVLDRKDIPNSFEYRGSIIFITNIDFTQVRSPRISNHLEAIVSRCHYMSLGINTLREKMIHICNVVEKNDMLSMHGFDQTQTDEVMDYVTTNSNRLREVSLRSVIKTADLRKAMPDRWKKFADKNVLKSV
jgi:hypothetical protein